MRWFKFDNNLVNDPTLQRLSGEKFKTLINMWCLVSSNGGVLPPASDLTFMLRPLTEEKITALIEEFVEKGLLDAIDGDPVRYVPRDWASRQQVDSTAAERSKRHRDKVLRHGGVTRDERVASGSVTPLDKEQIRKRAVAAVTSRVTLVDVRDDRALAAWDEHGRRVNGSAYPRNRHGGWQFPSEWPPGYGPEQEESKPAMVSIKGGRACD